MAAAMNSIFTQERERYACEQLKDLKRKLQLTEAQLTWERSKVSRLEAHLAIMKRNANKPRVIPAGDIEEGYECPTTGCYAKLVEDYRFCPGCGCELDWHPTANGGDYL